jgi:endonuclease YncB( thermonuclease family)
MNGPTVGLFFLVEGTMRALHLGILLATVSIFGVLPVNAATLFGKVIEVPDGDVITIMNMNRPARIRLMGVDAPEKNQPFGDVARQHLSDLVLGKT